MNPFHPGVAPILQLLKKRAGFCSCYTQTERFCVSPPLSRVGWDPALAAMFPNDGCHVPAGGRLVDALGNLRNRGLKVMGVPIGTPEYVEVVLGAKADKCVSKVDK